MVITYGYGSRKASFWLYHLGVCFSTRIYPALAYQITTSSLILTYTVLILFVYFKFHFCLQNLEAKGVYWNCWFCVMLRIMMVRLTTLNVMFTVLRCGSWWTHCIHRNRSQNISQKGLLLFQFCTSSTAYQFNTTYSSQESPWLSLTKWNIDKFIEISLCFQWNFMNGAIEY